MHECEQITSCLKSFTGSHYSPAKTPHFYMSTWGPSCYGASLPPQPPWPVLHPAVISNHLLTQISYARSSITCFWASAVSSVWRTHCCFCFSQLILGNAPQLSLILGRLPRPCCVLMTHCTFPYGICLYSDEQESLLLGSMLQEGEVCTY